ncbi:MAG: hypothetical protein WBF33_07555, partial [Candidatus Nitrosopolaris sp.]
KWPQREHIYTFTLISISGDKVSVIIIIIPTKYLRAMTNRHMAIRHMGNNHMGYDRRFKNVYCT